MNNYYIDINILPDPDFSEKILMSLVFNKLHQQLIRFESFKIGISFPEVKEQNLGKCLRIHGKEVDLYKLIEQKPFTILHDYIAQSDIKEIPSHSKFRVVKRTRPVLNALYFDSIIGKEYVSFKIPLNIYEKLLYPFVMAKSYSTDQKFKLYIYHAEIKDEPDLGSFDSYGLSKVATIPWF